MISLVSSMSFSASCSRAACSQSSFQRSLFVPCTRDLRDGQKVAQNRGRVAGQFAICAPYQAGDKKFRDADKAKLVSLGLACNCSKINHSHALTPRLVSRSCEFKEPGLRRVMCPTVMVCLACKCESNARSAAKRCSLKLAWHRRPIT